LPPDRRHVADLRRCGVAAGVGERGETLADRFVAIDARQCHHRAELQRSVIAGRDVIEAFDFADVHDALRRGNPLFHQVDDVHPPALITGAPSSRSDCASSTLLALAHSNVFMATTLPSRIPALGST
jgi:hypothetical protein